MIYLSIRPSFNPSVREIYFMRRIFYRKCVRYFAHFYRFREETCNIGNFTRRSESNFNNNFELVGLAGKVDGL